MLLTRTHPELLFVRHPVRSCVVRVYVGVRTRTVVAAAFVPPGKLPSGTTKRFVLRKLWWHSNSTHALFQIQVLG